MLSRKILNNNFIAGLSFFSLQSHHHQKLPLLKNNNGKVVYAILALYVLTIL